MKQDTRLFHTRDLGLLWGIENDNTLYTLIKRYKDKGILIPIHKGYYSTVPLERVDPILLGIGLLHSFAYVSCEYILAKAGIIFQVSEPYTLISSLSKTFTIGNHVYRSRKLKDEYLFNDAGVEMRNGYSIASLTRAVADILYYQPRYHFDNPKGIDWNDVHKVKKEVGYL